MNGSRKGSSWEREICKQLSLWWTYGKDEDVFWRTAGSGARATVRSKQNKNTFGQHGDIQATNPTGQRLIDVCCIELKRGYSKETFSSIIDKPENAAEQMYEKFIHQAELSSISAGSQSWLLIVKRDRREALIFMPYHFMTGLASVDCRVGIYHPHVSFSMKKNNIVYKIFGMTLNNFLKMVSPTDIKEIYKKNGYYPAVARKNK